MIFHLKRFDFNLRTLQRSKINDYFAFPETIDLQPYTIDFLSGESGARDKQDTFELVGVLVHSGTAESGHYYSYIRERPSQRNTSRWIEFNDDLVSNWDPGMLEDSTYGGTDRSAIYDANGIVYDKTYSAYMLFYQRAASVTSQEEALPPTSLLAPLRVEMNAALQQHIRDENILLLRRHCLFDQSHTRFVQACIGEATNPQESLATESEEKEKEHRVSHSLAVEVAVGHLDQVVSRAKDVPLFADFASLVHSQIRRCDDCALNFFVYFSERPAALRSLVQRNPDRNVRRETCKLFLAALDAIAAKLPSLYFYDTVSSPQSEESFDDEAMDVSNKDEDLSVLQGTVVLLDYLWRHFQVHIKSWDEYFRLVLDVAKRGRREAAQILAADYLARCLRIVSADAAMDLPSNFVRMLQNVYRRFATQPASYKAILALIDYLMRQLEPDLSQENIIEAAEERLKYGEGKFPWTSAEVNLVHYHPEQQNASIFIEKLLTIDQAHASAHSILERLVRSGHHMDQRISNTLRRMIQGDTTTEPLDPYMRAAPSFVDSTDSLDQAQRLIRHICAQAAGLQNNEGATFLEVFQALLDPQREEEEENGVVRYYATTTMPDWAPYLLVYPDGRVRGDAERLIEQELFQPVMPADGDSDMMAMEKMKALGEIALRLGTLCIQYFQDAHVKRRAQIERDTATEMIQVIAKCSQYVEMSVTLDEDSRSEFKESRMGKLSIRC
jgi:ubiquitin carboxyl-terminal hydrolase 34